MAVPKYVVTALMAAGLLLYAVRWLSPAVTVFSPAPGPLRQALAVLGAAPEQATIHAWTVLPASDANEAELRQTVRQVLEDLSIPASETQITSGSSPAHRLVRADMKGDGLTAAVIAQVLYPARRDVEPALHLVINIDTAPDLVDMWQGRLETVLIRQGGRGQIYTCLTGSFDGKLNDGILREKMHRAFAAVNASVDETAADLHIVSMSGYTRLLADGPGGRGAVNINMAVRYSPADGRTYCLVASPVITNEY